MTPLTADLPLSAPVNLRDLGGIPAAGGVLRPGVAIRADDLALTPREDAEAMVAAGLSAVIDLRTAAEVRTTGRGVFGELPVAYHHLPLLSGFTAAADRRIPSGPDEAARAMGTGYADLLATAADRVVTALAVIAFGRGATAFHCAAGKDRTGVLAAALLLTLGVEDDDIVGDYALTTPNLPAIGLRLGPVMAPLLAAHGLDVHATAALSGTADSSALAMETMLATLRRRHGDPLAPLRDAGLGPELVAALRRRAVDGAVE